MGWLGLNFVFWGIRGDEKYYEINKYVPGIRGDQRYFLKDLTNPPEKSLHLKNRSALSCWGGARQCNFKPDEIFELLKMKCHVYLGFSGFFIT